MIREDEGVVARGVGKGSFIIAVINGCGKNYSLAVRQIKISIRSGGERSERVN